MRYILLNIKSFFKNQKIIFIVIIICAFFSSFVLNFSYGLYKNFIAQKNNSIEENKDIVIEINSGAELTKSGFENFFQNLPYEIKENFYLCYIKLNTERFDITAVSRFSLKDEKYSCPDDLREYYNRNNLTSGSYFSEEDENSGEKIIISHRDIDEDSSIKLWGEEYKVVAIDHVQENFEIPFNSIPDSVYLKDYTIWMFNNAMDKRSYETIKATADEYIPGCLNFPDITLPDYDSIKVYNNIIIISLITSLLSTINIAMLFEFILRKRRKKYSIFRITGCNRLKIAIYYLLESSILIVPSYLIGAILFNIVLKTVFGRFYKYMSGVYSLKVYISIFIIYIIMSAISIIVVSLKSLNRSIVDEWRSN